MVASPLVGTAVLGIQQYTTAVLGSSSTPLEWAGCTSLTISTHAVLLNTLHPLHTYTHSLPAYTALTANTPAPTNTPAPGLDKMVITVITNHGKF